MVVTSPTCQLGDGTLVPEFDYVWLGAVPGTGPLVPGRCQVHPVCPDAPGKCSWPSYSLYWTAADCAKGAPFQARGPGGTQIGQDFGKGGQSSTIVFSPATKECDSMRETLISSVNFAAGGGMITRVEVETRCRPCAAAN